MESSKGNGIWFEKSKVASNHTLPWYYFIRTKKANNIKWHGTLANVCTIFIYKQNVNFYLQTKGKFKDLSQFNRTKTNAVLIHV